jgi:hypothetical protein
VPGTPGGPGSFGPVPGLTTGARSGAWVGAFLSAVAFGRFSIVIGPFLAYTGPLMPPSFRIRQKWTIMKMAAMSGKAITWST